jgi:hypothetical protein
MSRFEQAAVELAARGYYVFPLRPRTKEPLTGKGGFHHATRDERKILQWWDRYPDANIGVACGASGIVAFDVDSKHGADPDDVLAEYDVGAAPIVRTGEAPEPSAKYPRSLAGVRGGQAIFRGSLPTKELSLAGTETRGEGAYIVVAPSVHPSGVEYVGALPPVADLPPVPDWLPTLLPTASSNGAASPVGETIPKGTQHKTLVSLAGSMRRRGMGEEEIAAALKVTNRQRLEDPAPDANIEEIARSVCTLYQPAEPSRNGHHPEPPAQAPWPDPLAPEAFHGPAGEFVERVAPHSEADLPALLLQYLAAAGNLFGHGPHVRVEGDQHPARLFVALVGESAKGRKGTAWSRARQIAAKVDPDWAERIGGGLGSGEGPLWAVRDELIKTVPVKEKGKATGRFVEETTDPGVTDKRLLIVETELSRHFDVMGRQGNTLSETVRRLWDGGVIRSMTKNSPLKATDPHVSLVGHVSRDELRRKMTDTEAANGWGNRILWVAVRRRQKLPFGGDLGYEDLVVMQQALAAAVDAVRGWGEQAMTFAPDAAGLWEQAYNGELSVDRPGMVGAITARAEAQTLRIAVCYALLDQSARIELPHLRAALAVWKYAAASAAWAFGDQLGDPLADTIRDALTRAGQRGLSRSEIFALLGRNQPAERIDSALITLVGRGLARFVNEQTGGRPAQRWFATGGTS